MALPADFAKGTAYEIFDSIVRSAEAIFMKPVFWDSNRIRPVYDRQSFLICGAALVGKYVLTRDLEFAEDALQKLRTVLLHDCNTITQPFLYKSILHTFYGYLRWKDESYDLNRIHYFLESRCDIRCAIDLKNVSALEELCRRCEDVILRAQKAVLKDRSPTESIRRICNYLSSADEPLDETAMVDFEDMVQRLRKVSDRQMQLNRMERKFSLSYCDSDEEEEHPLQMLVTSMVIMQGRATPNDDPAKDGGGSGASSADEEENNVEKTIGELVDFTQFAIFEDFRISAEESYAKDNCNPDILTMLGAASLGISLFKKRSEDAIYCLETAVAKLKYALKIAPHKPDASFYLLKALAAIDLLKRDTTESVSCANDSVMGKENQKVAVNRKRKLGGMEYQDS